MPIDKTEEKILRVLIQLEKSIRDQARIVALMRKQVLGGRKSRGTKSKKLKGDGGGAA